VNDAAKTTFYDPSTKTINIEPSLHGSQDAVQHEVGHALDHALGWPSQTDAYKPLARPFGGLARGERAETYATAYNVALHSGATPYSWGRVNSDDVDRLLNVARNGRTHTSELGLTPSGPYASLSEAGGADDHFYGAWYGGRASEGGHPAGNWNDQLSGGVAAAVTSYTDLAYIPVNEYLRTGQVPSYNEQAPQTAESLRQALRPMADNMTLYRGTSGEGFDISSHMPQDQMLAHFQAMTGATISDKGFVSTSLNNDNLFWGGAPVRLLISAPAGTMGINVGSLGRFGGEREVILGPDTHFRIDSVEPLSGMWGDMKLADGVVLHVTVVPK
jgi:hypothetical protein